MERGLVSKLVACNALEPKRTGPAITRDPEEAERYRLEQMRECQRRRRALIREARELGEPEPLFTRGRPRKYTPEEAAEVKHQQNKECNKAYKKRIREGIERLTHMVIEQALSHDDNFFVGTYKDALPSCWQCSNPIPRQPRVS